MEKTVSNIVAQVKGGVSFYTPSREFIILKFQGIGVKFSPSQLGEYRSYLVNLLINEEGIFDIPADGIFLRFTNDRSLDLSICHDCAPNYLKLLDITMEIVSCETSLCKIWSEQ